MEKDAVQKKETEAIVEDAEKRAKKNEEDEENRRAVDAARAEMKAVLDGGLRLTQSDGQSDLRDAFNEIQKEMKEKFSTRLNTQEQNDHLATLMQGKRIREIFEIVPSDKPESQLVVKFQNINTDESAFVDQVSLLNTIALRNGTEDMPRYDNELRTELSLAFMLVGINSAPYPPISIDELYETIEKKGEEEAKVTTVGDKVMELHRRLGKIRGFLPLGTYPTVITAMSAWLEYQRNLTSPMRIGNFSTPPSEHS